MSITSKSKHSVLFCSTSLSFTVCTAYIHSKHFKIIIIHPKLPLKLAMHPNNLTFPTLIKVNALPLGSTSVFVDAEIESKSNRSLYCSAIIRGPVLFCIDRWDTFMNGRKSSTLLSFVSYWSCSLEDSVVTFDFTFLSSILFKISLFYLHKQTRKWRKRGERLLQRTHNKPARIFAWYGHS